MKEYNNGEIVVFWEPEKCIHSRKCIMGLPEVFDRSKKPWINMQGASSEEIARAIDRCPSGALSYKWAKERKIDIEPAASITIAKNGPLLVEGNCTLADSNGKEIKSYGPFALCRCGGSRNKPFCDSTHARTGFDDGR